MRTLSMIGLVVGLAAFGCEKPSSPSTQSTNPATKGSGLEVPAQGKQFEPPVKPEQLPANAWYCDMGTVHYARMDKADGKCPVCKMDLKQKK